MTINERKRFKFGQYLINMQRPAIKNKTQNYNTAELALNFPGSAEYFDGHFDEFAVLPGVVQIHFAIQFCAEFFGINANIENITKLKFSKIIEPDKDIFLELRYAEEDEKVTFKYFSGETTYSTGNINFTKFNPCIIIPVYNHGYLLKKSIGHIASFGYPIIIVDDGSALETVEILKEITNNYNNIKLITLPENQGKGAAVTAGFVDAVASAYSHALQIDADCQHNPNDIPIFLQNAKNNPDSLINGVPVYDNSVPKSRLYGRRITNFWVCIETLSRDIKDAMCGFRVYPLEKASLLLQKCVLSPRMGFDIEIIVRLHWKGVKIISQDTKVIYPADGLSNFNVFEDNVKISWVHTKLVFALLYRLLLRR